jgi:lipoate-protein ligase A
MICPHLNPLPQGEKAGFAASEGCVQLFTSLCVYRDIDSRSAAMNMAIDEALLEIAIKPSIRFYQWDHSALSFGYFGQFADVEKKPRDLVRRWTGGGIVFHGKDLTYSIVIPANDAAFAESSISIYEKAHAAIREALAANGKRAELAAATAVYDRQNQNTPALIERRYSECFSNPVRADVLSNGRKVAGAAQRRTRRGLLQQGSIQGVDIGNGFADRVAHALCRELYEKELGADLLARAQQIAEQKYATKAWLQRR